MWGLSCSTQNLLGDLLWHEGSFSCSIWTQLQHVGSSSLTMDQTPASLHWECEVLSTGPGGKSLQPYCRWDDFFFFSRQFCNNKDLRCCPIPSVSLSSAAVSSASPADMGEEGGPTSWWWSKCARSHSSWWLWLSLLAQPFTLLLLSLFPLS